MKHFEIKNPLSNNVIFEGEYTSFVDCVKDAIKKGVSLVNANFERVNFSWSNLAWSNLQGSNLQNSKMQGSNLAWSNLKNTNLKGVDIDFVAFPLWCNSLDMKTDEKLRIQLGFHFASLIQNADNASEEELLILSQIKNYVNKFHREEVERIE